MKLFSFLFLQKKQHLQFCFSHLFFSFTKQLQWIINGIFNSKPKSVVNKKHSKNFRLSSTTRRCLIDTTYHSSKCFFPSSSSFISQIKRICYSFFALISFGYPIIITSSEATVNIIYFLFSYFFIPIPKKLFFFCLFLFSIAFFLVQHFLLQIHSSFLVPQDFSSLHTEHRNILLWMVVRFIWPKWIRTMTIIQWTNLCNHSLISSGNHYHHHQNKLWQTCLLSRNQEESQQKNQEGWKQNKIIKNMIIIITIFTSKRKINEKMIKMRDFILFISNWNLNLIMKWNEKFIFIIITTTTNGEQQ